MEDVCLFFGLCSRHLAQRWVSCISLFQEVYDKWETDTETPTRSAWSILCEEFKGWVGRSAQEMTAYRDCRRTEECEEASVPKAPSKQVRWRKVASGFPERCPEKDSLGENLQPESSCEQNLPPQWEPAPSRPVTFGVPVLMIDSHLPFSWVMVRLGKEWLAKSNPRAALFKE